MSELKPRPFCGGEAARYESENFSDRYRVNCMDCGSEATDEELWLCDKRWYTRHEEQRLAESLTKAVDVGFKFNSTIRNELDTAKAEIAELRDALLLADSWLDIEYGYAGSPVCHKIKDVLAKHKGE